MKKFITVLGILIVAGVIALPVLADGPGWGMGNHMMGHGGRGHGYSGHYDMGYGDLTREQSKNQDQFDRKFYNETADLRDEIGAKSAELDKLLNSPDTDTEKIRALQKEISDLRAGIDEKRLDFELEARKANPDARYGMGYGMGSGSHMGGYGSDNCPN